MAEKLPNPPRSAAQVLDWSNDLTAVAQAALDRLDREKFAYPLGGRIFNRHTTSTVQAIGTTQGGAAELTTEWTELSVGTSGVGGGRLVAAYAGVRQVVFNPGTAAVSVYPSSGERIGTAGTNAAVTIGVGTTADFRAMSAGRWSVLRGS